MASQDKRSLIMSEQSVGVDAYVAVISSSTPEALAALEAVLADDVVVAGPIGGATGREAVIAALVSRTNPDLFVAAEWSEPTLVDGSVTTTAKLPSGMPIAGMTFAITLDGAGKITRVGQQMQAAPPPPATELKLTPEIAAAVNGALMNATPIIVAYVDAGGVPHLSLRGTTQVYGDQQLAIWIRDAEGGLLKAIETNPALTFFYRDPATRAVYQFTGRGHADADPAVRDVVFDNSPEPERNIDPQRAGVAVVVELDKVEGGGPGGRIRMERSVGS
jgi:hypothetical protein